MALLYDSIAWNLEVLNFIHFVCRFLIWVSSSNIVSPVARCKEA